MAKAQFRYILTQKSQIHFFFVQATKHITSLKFKSFGLTIERAPEIEHKKGNKVRNFTRQVSSFKVFFLINFKINTEKGCNTYCSQRGLFRQTDTVN